MRIQWNEVWEGNLGISDDDGTRRTNAFSEKIWISMDSKARRESFSGLGLEIVGGISIHWAAFWSCDCGR